MIYRPHFFFITAPPKSKAATSRRTPNCSFDGALQSAALER
jgi:hypothetical protein